MLINVSLKSKIYNVYKKLLTTRDYKLIFKNYIINFNFSQSHKTKSDTDVSKGVYDMVDLVNFSKLL